VFFEMKRKAQGSYWGKDGLVVGVVSQELKTSILTSSKVEFSFC
jgi:hypothetical protein